MVRIIKTGSAGKDRLLLEKGIVMAMREYNKQSNNNHATYDLIAFIVVSLNAIWETIDESVSAWEKRGYWVKADRYRMEWSWSVKMSDDLKTALLKEDWQAVENLFAQISQKLSKIIVSSRKRKVEPWVGSWEKLIRPKQSQ